MTTSHGVGYICSLVAMLFFGSNFVPVKRFETYDGMFYQWVMCAAIWIWGLLLQLVLIATDDVFELTGSNTTDVGLIQSSRPDKYSVKFFPFAALGGALWATGNTMSVPIINWIGLSMGLLIWGAANMLMGWATGAFGLFGLPVNELQNKGLNYTGVALAVVALGLYSQIKATLGKEKSDVGLQPLNAESGKAVEENPSNSMDGHVMLTPEPPLLEDLAPPDDGPTPAKRAAGVVMAVVAGLLYGNNFTPPQYMVAHTEGPDNDHILSYVFSHFTGIFATSTFWFLVYCCVMRSNPRINPRLVLPGFVSGIMWAIANTCWFIANNALSFSVSFPLITSGPGIISALWGIFVFGEIKGKRNFIMLGLSMFLSITGCVLIAVSGPK